MTPGAAWEKRLAMQFGARKDRAENMRQPLGESVGFRLRADEILAHLNEETGEPPPRDFLIQRIAPKRAIIGFVVADVEASLAQRRHERLGETRIAVPQDTDVPRPWPHLP